MKLPKNQKYIPGFFPFFYLIHEKNTSGDKVNFKLIKAFAFSLNKEELINQSILRTSNHMDFLKLAKKISQEYRFFHKWSLIIPFIHENEDLVNVVLILTESYSQAMQHKSLKRGKSSYFLSINFNKNIKQVISKVEGFGSFNKWKNKT